jgi:cell wall-associated NlpC family hydrolase
VRRTWLAGAAVAAAAISVPFTVAGGTAQAATLSGHTAAKSTAAKRPATFDQVAAALAKKLVGAPYLSGGTSPAGFDCSGLTQYVYAHTGGGKAIPRTSEDQFLAFRRISKADARPGDLVFFHDTSSPSSYVYHVGVYEGGDDIVAAATPGQGVVLQSFTWAGDTITYGTISH